MVCSLQQMQCTTVPRTSHDPDAGFGEIDNGRNLSDDSGRTESEDVHVGLHVLEVTDSRTLQLDIYTTRCCEKVELQDSSKSPNEHYVQTSLES